MALDELVVKGLTSSHSRRQFLKKMGIIGGGVMAMSVIGEGLSFGVAAAQTASGDASLLQFGFLLENVAVAAYKGAAGSGLLSPDVVAVGTKFAGQHQQHANALKAALQGMNGTVPEVPTKFNFPAFKSQDDILNFALALESAAVGAYYTAIGKFDSRDLAVAASTIVGVEATHVTLLNSAMKKDPLPTAFVTGTPFSEVQATANSILGGGTSSGSTSSGGQGGAAPSSAPATGQGASAPNSMPATGQGNSHSSNDFTGAGLGVAGLFAAAAAAGAALNRAKKTAVTPENDEQ